MLVSRRSASASSSTEVAATTDGSCNGGLAFALGVARNLFAVRDRTSSGDLFIPDRMLEWSALHTMPFRLHEKPFAFLRDHVLGRFFPYARRFDVAKKFV